MNWEAIGATGEVLGALAVVISVLYLSFQIKHNTRQLKEDQRDRTQDQMTALRTLMLDRDLAGVIRAGIGASGEIDPIDASRFSTWLNQYVWTHYQVWDRYRRNSADETWRLAAGPNIGKMLTTPGGEVWWERNKGGWEPEFVDEIEMFRSLAKASGDA